MGEVESRELPFGVRVIITGMLWVLAVMIIQHSGPGVVDKLLEWPMYLLGGALIVAGIAREVLVIE